MRAVMVMFDSLNRRMLPPYGSTWVHAPNFHRLAQRTVTFDRCFVGSMPCVPARRELHTGRYNFLHRSWGPLEPFDDSMPRILKEKGVYTHLVSDHLHYWEPGGATYHTSYSSWEISRGQEGDQWKGEVAEQELPEHLGQLTRQDWVNRKYLSTPESQPQAVTFSRGVDFIRKNRTEDSWFLQIETFDPHEPFFTHRRFKDLYPHEYDGPMFDWPFYRKVTEPRTAIEHLRYEYAALVSMCDWSLGKVLDLFDEYDLWSDTMLIVNTDHGFLLGEHDWWAKTIPPFYNELAHIPLFIWDPRSRKAAERRNALVQTIDLPATILDFFDVPLPEDMEGRPLREVIESERALRDYALFGIHGGHVNCTDGRFLYMRAPTSPDNSPLYNYTLMPTHMESLFSTQELRDASLEPAFRFTKGVPVLRVPADPNMWTHAYDFGTMLFDLESDPGQSKPLRNAEEESRMLSAMTGLMEANDAPAEQYTRLGVDRPG